MGGQGKKMNWSEGTERVGFWKKKRERERTQKMTRKQQDEWGGKVGGGKRSTQKEDIGEEGKKRGLAEEDEWKINN